MKLDRVTSDPSCVFIGLQDDHEDSFVNSCTGDAVCVSQSFVRSSFSSVQIILWNVLHRVTYSYLQAGRNHISLDGFKACCSRRTKERQFK